jgi:hypothetical protein
MITRTGNAVTGSIFFVLTGFPALLLSAARTRGAKSHPTSGAFPGQRGRARNWQMTKRLTALGFAAVAVVWGPYVYAELARKPLPAATVEPPSPIIEATPVVYESPATERAQLLAALAAARETAAASAAQDHAAEPDAPEPPGGLQPAAANPTTSLAAATDPAALAAPELPQVQLPQPAAADPAAHPAQPTAAPAQPPTSAEAQPAKDDSADGQPAVAAKEEPSPDAKRETAKEEVAVEAKHEDTKADAPTPESLAPAFRSTFDRESRDATWANGEEPRLTKLLAGAGVPESAISEVRCQSTVCRIALNSADLKAVQQSPLYQLIASRVKDEFGTLGLDANGEGEQHAAFYILRKGYELEHARDTN